MAEPKKQFAAYFQPQVQGTRVMRCQGTSVYRPTPELARDLGEKDGRAFVVADQHGTVEAV